MGYLHKSIEPAGRSFHASYEKPKIQAKKKGNRPSKDKDADSDDDQEVTADASWKKKKRQQGGGDKKVYGSLKLSHLLEDVNLYELMEVAESAPLDQIKKQYRKLVLQHHPDKQGEAKPVEETKEKPGFF